MQLRIDAKVAAGAFSNLYRGYYCGQEVAVKILKDVQDDTTQYQEFLQVWEVWGRPWRACAGGGGLCRNRGARCESRGWSGSLRQCLCSVCGVCERARVKMDKYMGG
eukprot:278839-Chlamydomonas_euryale.AAC.1